MISGVGPPFDQKTLERTCLDFARDIRWMWKLGTVHHVQGADGRPTATVGGWGSVVREVTLEGVPLLLKGWPRMSAIDRRLGNALDRLGALGLRYVPASARERVRHNLRRTRSLSSRGVPVPRCFEVAVAEVLVMERLTGYEALRSLRDRDLTPLGDKLDALRAVARALRRMHDAGAFHGEPGAGNILLPAAGGGRAARGDRVAFVDFDWCYRPGVPLIDKQALDLRYFALQQAARLSARGEAPARAVIREIYRAYGPSEIFTGIERFAVSGPAMFQEALGYFGVSVKRHRRLQGLSLEVIAEEGLALSGAQRVWSAPRPGAPRAPASSWARGVEAL